MDKNETYRTICLSLYNPRLGGFLYTPAGLPWTKIPFYLLHIRGIFPSARDLFAFWEILTASGSAGPLAPAPCRPFADQVVPSRSGVSAPCPLASSPSGKNLQGQTYKQATSIRIGKMALTTTMITSPLIRLRYGERSGPSAWTVWAQNMRLRNSPWWHDSGFSLWQKKAMNPEGCKAGLFAQAKRH